MLSEGRRLAVVVASGEIDTLAEMARVCGDAARSGRAVRVFFRDESIPAICRVEVAARLIPATAISAEHEGEPDATDAPTAGAAIEAALQELAGAGDVRLYACSSSLYIWGVESRDLIPAISGARGLIAFLADDLAGASEVLTY